MKSLKDILSQTKRTEFKFINFEKDYAESDGSMIAILQLETPIPIVTGSQSITDGVTSEKIVAYDVTTVKVHESEIDDNIVVNDDGRSGTVSTDKRLDVAKSTGEVWLTAQSFSAASREMRQDSQIKRRESLLQAIRDRKAAATSSAKPAPVASKPEKVQPVVTK